MATKQTAHKLNRENFKIMIGGVFKYYDDKYKITQLIDFQEVIGVNIKTNEAKRLLISNLKPIKEDDVKDNGYIYEDIDGISDDDWKTIKTRLEYIKPLMNGATRKEIDEHANKLNIHFTTLYRWLRGYKSTGTVIGVLSLKKGRKKGAVFIAQDIERIMQDVIENEYLTEHKPSLKYIYNRVKIKCLEKNLTFPSNGTIRNRVNKISKYKVLKNQVNLAIANDTYKPAHKHFTAEYPLQKVQIDHTKIDLQILDDEHRQPIGRAWITLAIDIYSRMIVGYYLSLDAPSGTSVGMCIVNSILPKDKLLASFDINEEWNIWGKMDNIYTDNGSDFRSYSVERACLANGIHMQFRPIGKKEYGGHIERLIGTTMTEVHDIPGTTFSNIQEKLYYDSEGNACITFSELEKWCLLYFTKIYQNSIHSSIKTTPLEKWKQGIFGTNNSVGIGYPQVHNDPTSLILDFLPTIKRTIQKYGVSIDGLVYYDPILRTKIRGLERMMENPNQKNPNMEYVFKRDPRDISHIWFFDDIQQEYYEIPLSNPEIPKMSLSELNIIKKNIQVSKNQILNEINIIQGYKELYEHIEDSIQKTKKARRQRQMSKNNAQKAVINNLPDNKHKSLKPTSDDSGIWAEEIPDFD